MKLKNIMLSEISCKKKKTKNRGEQILYDSTHTTYQKQANSEEKLDQKLLAARGRDEWEIIA